MDGRKLPNYVDVDGFRIPGAFSPKALRDALQYKPRPDDVFIVTFPKCGTTWMQFIVYLIYHKGEYPKTTIEFFTSCPFMEMAGVEAIEVMSRPGAIKTHLPFQLQPYSSEAKYIYVARNPKDCCVSFYYHTESNFVYDFVGGKFEDYFEVFIEGKNDFGDYFDHVLSWYEHRNDPNVLFLTYEDMKKDVVKSIGQVAGFLGDEYSKMLETDPSMLDKIVRHSSFEFMKKEFNSYKEMDNTEMMQEVMTPALKHVLDHAAAGHSKDFELVRKGVVGDWRSMFSVEQNLRMDAKIEEKLAGTELLKFWKDNM